MYERMIMEKKAAGNEVRMGRTVAIGIQSFEQIIENDVFYIKKKMYRLCVIY